MTFLDTIKTCFSSLQIQTYSILATSFIYEIFPSLYHLCDNKSMYFRFNSVNLFQSKIFFHPLILIAFIYFQLFIYFSMLFPYFLLMSLLIYKKRLIEARNYILWIIHICYNAYHCWIYINSIRTVWIRIIKNKYSNKKNIDFWVLKTELTRKSHYPNPNCSI